MTTDSLAADPQPVARAGREETVVVDFAEFYAEYYPRLIRYCYRLVRDEQTAFDLAQEAFARLFTRWIKLRDPAAYLFHVATNLARTAYARQQREATAAAATTPAAAGGEALYLRLAVSRLPRRYREIVLLYYFADLPVVRVAEAVRRPKGTVMRQLSEARALLARELRDR